MPTQYFDTSAYKKYPKKLHYDTISDKQIEYIYKKMVKSARLKVHKLVVKYIQNRSSLARASRIREPPIRLPNAAERVAANIPITTNGGHTLISCMKL